MVNRRDDACELTSSPSRRPDTCSRPHVCLLKPRTRRSWKLVCGRRYGSDNQAPCVSSRWSVDCTDGCVGAATAVEDSGRRAPYVAGCRPTAREWQWPSRRRAARHGGPRWWCCRWARHGKRARGSYRDAGLGRPIQVRLEQGSLQGGPAVWLVISCDERVYLKPRHLPACSRACGC